MYTRVSEKSLSGPFSLGSIRLCSVEVVLLTNACGLSRGEGRRVGAGPGEGEAGGLVRGRLDEEAKGADATVYVPEVVGDLLGGEEMIAILAVRKVVGRQVGSTAPGQSTQPRRRSRARTHAYPDRMISSSTPYSFMCCKPQPSLILLGMYRFRKPVRLGVWYMRISTRSAPNSLTRGASSDAHDGLGASRVPRSASVRMLSFNSGLRRSASRRVSMSSRSDLPMYSVDRKTRRFALRMRSYESTVNSRFLNIRIRYGPPGSQWLGFVP